MTHDEKIKGIAWLHWRQAGEKVWYLSESEDGPIWASVTCWSDGQYSYDFFHNGVVALSGAAPTLEVAKGKVRDEMKKARMIE